MYMVLLILSNMTWVITAWVLSVVRRLVMLGEYRSAWRVNCDLL